MCKRRQEPFIYFASCSRREKSGSGSPSDPERLPGLGPLAESWQKSGQPKSEQATPSNTDGPTQVQYTELFIFTFCSAPTGELPSCYACLLPPAAPYNQPCYPLSLFGWWVELTQALHIFMTNDGKVGPNIELLQPRPAT